MSESARRVPDAEKRIAFDKYHVASHLGEAVDRVRRAEHREMAALGESPLKGTKYLWLQNPAHMKRERKKDLLRLSDTVRKTARAWALKETAMGLWRYRSETWARKGWNAWLSWAVRSRLEPMRQKARMVKKHLQGILNAVVTGITNAASESVNAKIQAIKRMACGYRNRERFRNAIYFHCGGLDLYPASLAATHTTS